MKPQVDLAIAGGGPAGLACAIWARRAGLSCVVLEKREQPGEKACGEGLMPAGRRELQALGALERIPREAQSPFHGIRYLPEGGRAVEGRFRDGEGLGVQRAALRAALEELALAGGARLQRAAVQGATAEADGVRVDTDQGPLGAALLVAADGLHSPLRARAGLASPRPGPRRFGLRRHFARAPWTDLVEVHLGEGAECYVTPVGPEAINVAFLWDAESLARQRLPVDFASLLARFPAVQERLGAATPLDRERGSGPLWQPVRARTAERLALVGDAAGYVDAITGQGLSLALRGARTLVSALRPPLTQASLRRSLQTYERALRGPYRGYALPAQALLFLAARPLLRRAALDLVCRSPRLFGALLATVG